uniref:Uncharacterized protein n=1 Tax=Setaria digitata TaxID=48799 RepID=A0A915PUB9_9BILA
MAPLRNDIANDNCGSSRMQYERKQNLKVRLQQYYVENIKTNGSRTDADIRNVESNKRLAILSVLPPVICECGIVRPQPGTEC